MYRKEEGPKPEQTDNLAYFKGNDAQSCVAATRGYVRRQKSHGGD